MTRRDYLTVAAILHAERQHIKHEATGTPHSRTVTKQANHTLERIETQLIEAFKADNPLFNEQRFSLASGRRSWENGLYK